MKHIFENATLYAVAFLFINTVSLCMEQKEMITLDKPAQALHVLLEKKLHLFEHKMLCSVGHVCKSFNEVCIKAAPSIKKHFEQYSEIQDLPEESRIWYKYGSACGSARKKYLALRVLNSYESGRRYPMGGMDAMIDYCGPVIGFERPYFNEEGDLYCYYIGGNCNIDDPTSVMEVILSDSILPHFRHWTCSLYYESETGAYDYELYHFIQLPALLKAFLNSSFVYEFSRKMPLKSFNLKDAIIPENYKECSKPNSRLSFDYLPEGLKDAIIARYKELQQKK